jgi:hypothetical protein
VRARPSRNQRIKSLSGDGTTSYAGTTGLSALLERLTYLSTVLIGVLCKKNRKTITHSVGLATNRATPPFRFFHVGELDSKRVVERGGGGGGGAWRGAGNGGVRI